MTCTVKLNKRFFYLQDNELAEISNVRKGAISRKRVDDKSKSENNRCKDCVLPLSWRENDNLDRFGFRVLQFVTFWLDGEVFKHLVVVELVF